MESLLLYYQLHHSWHQSNPWTWPERSLNWKKKGIKMLFMFVPKGHVDAMLGWKKVHEWKNTCSCCWQWQPDLVTEGRPTTGIARRNPEKRQYPRVKRGWFVRCTEAAWGLKMWRKSMSVNSGSNPRDLPPTTLVIFSEFFFFTSCLFLFRKKSLMGGLVVCGRSKCRLR